MHQDRIAPVGRQKLDDLLDIFLRSRDRLRLRLRLINKTNATSR